MVNRFRKKGLLSHWHGDVQDMFSVLGLLLWVTVPQEAPVILVEGAGGTPEYAARFSDWGDRWKTAGEAGGRTVIRIQPQTDQKVKLLEQIKALPPSHGETVWLILLGHGTFDGRQARFNMQGPDLTPEELKLALNERPEQEEWVIIQASAASGPFLAPLSGSKRIVLTATRSGDELSVSRLGGILPETLQDPDADLDQDDQVSLLEAFISSGLRVTAFYESEKRLVTEHALLDDNGDGKGTPQDWFRGLRMVKRAADGVSTDGIRAKQLHLIPSPWEAERTSEWREQRDRLERQLQELKERKDKLKGQAYQEQLEQVVEQLAALYRETRSK